MSREPAHLVARFVRVVRAAPPDAADDAWAAGFLTPGGAALYAAMPDADRRHAVDGGRLVAGALAPDDPDRAGAVEAALVHDVGKRHARLGPVGRSVATVVGWVVRSDGRRAVLARRGGPTGRIGRYLRHDLVGAAEVEAAGGSALATAWTRDHHHPARFAALPARIATVAALDRADRET